MDFKVIKNAVAQQVQRNVQDGKGKMELVFSEQMSTKTSFGKLTLHHSQKEQTQCLEKEQSMIAPAVVVLSVP